MMIHSLLDQICHVNSQAGNIYKKFRFVLEKEPWSRLVRSVEIVRDDQLERIYFIVPQV